MGKYVISTDVRYYLDAILNTFIYDKINHIQGAIEKIVSAENSNMSKKEIYLLTLHIQDFLEKNKFGHYSDYVFIIDQKGIDLKNAGSLSAYEDLNSIGDTA
jgi:hypothetical protein